ncbi:MAG TPA: methyltransferase domain-containing protein [Candidatus Methylomirabilis sp.]|nr:methyltransferase domain-containing protein [Candidatus Methylomirabilis sp.]
MNGLLRLRRVAVLVATLGLVISAGAWPGVVHGPFAQVLTDPKLAPFVPTPQSVVEMMLTMAEVTKNDVVYDLGSGDGRIVITAAKQYGAKGVGFELDDDLIKQAQENARKEGVSHLVAFRKQDVMTVDLSPATVVTLYLLPEANLRLRPKILSQLRVGARVVSHDYDMGDWAPLRVEEVRIPESSHASHTIYLWRIDARRPKP